MNYPYKYLENEKRRRDNEKNPRLLITVTVVNDNLIRVVCNFIYKFKPSNMIKNRPNFKNLLVRIYESRKKMVMTNNIIREMEALGKPTDVYRRNLQLLEKDIRSCQLMMKKNYG